MNSEPVEKLASSEASSAGGMMAYPNNAGIVRLGPITETEPAVWRQVIDINLTGTYLGIRAIVPSPSSSGERPSLLLEYVREHHVCALADEAARVAGTHSTGTARDNHCPVVETFHDSLVQFSYQHRAHDSQRKAVVAGPVTR